MADNKTDFLEECLEFFGSKNLYEILGVDKTAKENEIKRAYRKKSLKVHPDRATDDRKEHAKQAFQTLTKVSCYIRSLVFTFDYIFVINLGSLRFDKRESSQCIR